MGFETSLFVDQPVDNGLICNICLGVFDKPTTACSNGHFYCSDCLLQTKNSSNDNISRNCPECRLPMLTAQILNRPLLNLLLAQKVRCINSSNSNGSSRSRRRLTEAGESIDAGRCGFAGTLASYVETNHAESCHLRMVKCSLGCDELVIFSEMTGHQATCPHRAATCPYCMKSTKFHLLQSHQANECPEKSVQCGFCNVQLKRKNLGTIKGQTTAPGLFSIVLEKDLTGHYKCCPKILLNCEFHSLGCATKLPRQRLAAHHAEKAQYHASLLAKKTKGMEEDMSKMKRGLQQEISRLKSETTTKFHVAQNYATKEACWEISKAELRSEGNLCINSKTFPVGGHYIFFRLSVTGDAVEVAIVIESSRYKEVTFRNVTFESDIWVDGEYEDAEFSTEGDNFELDGTTNQVTVRGSLKWYDDESDEHLSMTRAHLVSAPRGAGRYFLVRVTVEVCVNETEFV